MLFKWDGLRLHAERDTGVARPIVVERADDQDQRVGLNNTRRLAFDVLALSGIVFDQTTGAID